MIELPIIDQYLKEQREMTAVERFAQFHAQDRTTHQAKHYEALLPAQPPGPGQQYAFEVNLDACSGCKACVTACHNLNGLDAQETWRSVGLVIGKKQTTENAPASCGRVVAQPVSDVDTKSLAAATHYQQHITTACHHCVDPSCMEGCPVNAYDKDPLTGIVKHLDDQCIGCQYCVYTCSYGVPQYNPERGIVRKCDMCTGRLAVGEAPACVQACPNEAIRITLVDTSKVRAASAAQFNVPSSPDPAYSLPTTQYKTARKFPDNAHAADEEEAWPQPAEYPLVIMLTLTQMAVGTFLGLAFFSSGTSLGATLAAGTAAAMTMAGLAASTFHLGRPLYAFRVVMGLRRSWLSREAVVFGAFAPLACASVLFLKWPLVLWSAALIGLFGVYCSAKIYMKTPRAWWKSKATLGKFFLTTATGGLWLLACAQAFETWHSGQHHFSLPWLLAGVILGTIAKVTLEIQVLRHLHDSTFTALKKTARLLTGPLKTFSVGRLGVGALGGLLLPAVLLLSRDGSLIAALVAGTGLLVWTSGELLERHLFFRAVVPPKMPGAI